MPGRSGVTVNFSARNWMPAPQAMASYRQWISALVERYDGDGQDEILMAWFGGGWANLKVYDPQGSIHPVATSKVHDEQVGNGNVEVAAGDFDGDGNDEVVLAWEDAGNWSSASSSLTWSRWAPSQPIRITFLVASSARTAAADSSRTTTAPKANPNRGRIPRRLIGSLLQQM